MRLANYSLIFLFVLTTFICLGQEPVSEYEGLPENVVEAIQERMGKGYHPSVAIGILDENGARYYNFGVTTKGGEEVDEHTIYEIGSITKVFTAIILAKQVLQESIDLSEPIQEGLPDTVKVPVWESSQITYGNLTDHTSSLPRMPTNFTPADWENPFADYTVEQMYTFLSGYELPRAIGSKYEYSNLAQGLLGHILALKAGKPYEDLMIETIAEPLEMNETRIVLSDEMQANLAIGYNFGRNVSNWDIPTLAGAGAIRSSIFDMIKFLAANLGYKETPLRSAMDLSHQVRHDMAGSMRVAMGWHINQGSEGDVIWHNGGTGGYRAFAGFVKETGKGVVVLTNSATSLDDIGFHLLDPESKLN